MNVGPVVQKLKCNTPTDRQSDTHIHTQSDIREREREIAGSFDSLKKIQET
jgi:hypothetical protein